MACEGPKIAPLFFNDNTELHNLIRRRLILPYLTGSFHSSFIEEYAGGLLMALQKPVGMFVDSEIVLSTSYGKTRVFINKTLSTETAYQQDLINRDLLSTRLIRGKVGPGMWCVNCNSTSV